jgi:DNA-binding response OmpR family regulator
MVQQRFSDTKGEHMDKQRILIVDDSELVLAMARDALEDAGYEVLTATNGIEANSYIFSKNKPDLIILDVMLPMLDGNKKAKLLREKEFSKYIPIILISSKSEEELTRLTAEAGVDGFIRKPFTPNGIVSKVRDYLARRPL